MTKPQMTLPTGDVLIEGDYGVTRDGQKVGPVELLRYPDDFYKFICDDYFYGNNGRVYDFGETSNSDIIAKWVDAEAVDDTPPLWRDMTPEQKGALLLDKHEGVVIEWTTTPFAESGWGFCPDQCLWDDDFMYRRKPEPKVETVTIFAKNTGEWGWVADNSEGNKTHRFTMTIRDGKVDPVAQVEEL